MAQKRRKEKQKKPGTSRRRVSRIRAFSLREFLYLLGFFALVILAAMGAERLLLVNIKPEKFSIDLELSLKKQTIRTLKLQGNLIEGREVNRAVERIMDRLLKEAGTNIPPYGGIDVLVLHDPMVNALTFPGGLIVITTGMIDFMENPEEMASVLAHELGHVVNRDVLKKIARDVGISVLVSLSGGEGSVILEDLIESVISSSFTRKQEHRADMYSHNMMLALNMSPGHFADLFQRMIDKKRIDTKAESLFRYISSHPETEKRIRTARRKAEDLEGIPGRFRYIDWLRVQRSLPD